MEGENGRYEKKKKNQTRKIEKKKNKQKKKNKCKQRMKVGRMETRNQNNKEK